MEATIVYWGSIGPLAEVPRSQEALGVLGFGLVFIDLPGLPKLGQNNSPTLSKKKAIILHTFGVEDEGPDVGIINPKPLTLNPKP